MQYTYEYNGVSHTVYLMRKGDGQFVAVLNGTRELAVTVTALNDHTWQFTTPQGQTLVYTASQGAERHVQLGGQSYTLARTDNRPKKRTRSTAGNELTAQMPAQITDVRVETGQTVQAGQVLLIMEAMKMEIRVTAPSDGTVARLMVEKGQMVARGQVLAEMSD